MRRFPSKLVLIVLALSAVPALAAELPPPPPPPPPPPADSPSNTNTVTPSDVPPPPSGEAPAVEVKNRTNWAKPAAFIGFGVAAGVLTLSVIAQVIGTGVYENTDGFYLGGGSFVMLLPFALTAAGGPVVYFGGNSARWTKSITGSKPLRVVGWITYGVGLFVQFLSLFAPPLPILGGLIGAGSLTCFGLDALFSANEAADVASMASADDGIRMRPTVSLLPGFGGAASGAVIGMSGAF